VLKDGDSFSIGKYTLELKHQVSSISVKYAEQEDRQHGVFARRPRSWAR